MSPENLTDTQKEILRNAARRLRQSADQLERVILSGEDEQLTNACGLLHATDTQIRWVQHQGEARSRKAD